MSGNRVNGSPVNNRPKVVQTTAKLDRRVLRTRDTLGDALVELMQEKPFDGITVQEVLDRAGVARSTFYKHYRDKDDLFLSDVEDFFASASTMLTRTKADLRRLAPIREMFAHIANSRKFYVSLAASGMLDEAKVLGRGFFARSIEERLRLAGVQLTPAEMSPTAHALSGSMFALLDWWADHGMKMEPEGMDRIFHARAWAGIGSTPSAS